MPFLTKKPREVICFFPVEFPTQQGDAYIFIAYDVASEYIFQLGAGMSNDIDMVLQHIQILMDNNDFKRHDKQPFILVLHKHQEYRQQIEQIIKPHYGTLAFDDAFLAQQLEEPIRFLYQSMMKRPS